MSVQPETGVQPLPDPTHVEMSLGALIIALERRHPGITLEMIGHVQAASERSAVTRIRGPSASFAVRRALDGSVRWLHGVLGFVPPVKVKKRKRRI